MTTERHFVIDTADYDAAQAALMAGLQTAAAAIGMGDLVPSTWDLSIDVPAARLNALLPANQRVTADDFLRVDLAALPLSYRDPVTLAPGPVVAHVANLLLNIRFETSKEAALGTALTAWWLAVPTTTRALDPGAAAWPGAVGAIVHARTVNGVTVSLLASPPAAPKLVFA